MRAPGAFFLRAPQRLLSLVLTAVHARPRGLAADTAADARSRRISLSLSGFCASALLLLLLLRMKMMMMMMMLE